MATKEMIYLGTPYDFAAFVKVLAQSEANETKKSYAVHTRGQTIANRSPDGSIRSVFYVPPLSPDANPVHVDISLNEEEAITIIALGVSDKTRITFPEEENSTYHDFVSRIIEEIKRMEKLFESSIDKSTKPEESEHIAKP